MLKVNYVSFPDANIKVPYNNGQFTAQLPADGNYSKYLNVELNGICINTGTFDGNVTLNVQKENTNSYVKILIPEKITCAAGSKPITTIKEGTKVLITTNVDNVSKALGESSVYPNIDKTLINYDLSVNLKQLESAVTKDNNKISKLENAVGDYLEKDAIYDVTINIKGNYTSNNEASNTNSSTSTTNNSASAGTTGSTFRINNEVNDTIKGEIIIGNPNNSASAGTTGSTFNENSSNTSNNEVSNTNSSTSTTNNSASAGTIGSTF